MKKTDYNFLLKLLEKMVGWSFSDKQYFVIDKKISNFVRSKGYIDVDELIKDLKTGNKFLIEQIIEELAMSDTYFYRDYEVFMRFEKNVLPHIKSSYRSVKSLNVWSCGCSTGQEVYSILMALKHNHFFPDWNVSIMGTDLCSPALSIAQRGIYSYFDVQMGLNIKTIVENFTQIDNSWQINSQLQSKTEFRKYNLLDNLIFNKRFDIVFCRNVMSFFNAKLQSQILERIHSTQPVGGLLYLGLNESVADIEKFYEKVVGFECLYQAKALEVKVNKTEFIENFKGDTMPKFVRPDSLIKSTFK